MKLRRDSNRPFSNWKTIWESKTKKLKTLSWDFRLFKMKKEISWKELDSLRKLFKPKSLPLKSLKPDLTLSLEKLSQLKLQSTLLIIK